MEIIVPKIKPLIVRKKIPEITSKIDKTGLRLYLDFVELSGNLALDQSGYGNHGTIYGASRVKRLGYDALYFDGVDDYCFSEDTEVLTQEGWKRVSEVSYEDKIATLNPETDELEYQHPSRLFNFEYSGKMCHFYGRHLDLLVTPDHNVYVSRYKSGADWYPYQLEKAEDVLTEYVRFKKDCKWSEERKEHFILSAIENCEEKYLPMDTWLKFFGWWLAEGDIREYRNSWTKSSYYQIRISQKGVNAENCREVEEVIESLGWEWSYSGHNYYIWSGYNKQLVQYLKQFGKSESKFIPQELKNLPPEQLKILYSALMKGDGHRNQFYTKSKRLADDVQEICLKLGYSADVSFWWNRKYPIYAVGLEKTNTQPRINEYRSNRRVYANGELVDYNGRVYGITVPQYHIIYVRRNGKACWAGNCDCGSDESLDITGPLTLEAWIKSNDASQYRQFIVEKVDDVDQSPNWHRLYGLVLDGNNIYFHLWDGTNYFSKKVDNVIQSLVWYHIVGVYDGTNMRVYINGQEQGSPLAGPSSIATSSKSLFISSRETWTTYFNGLIAEVRIYNRALSAREIKEHFELERVIFGV